MKIGLSLKTGIIVRAEQIWKRKEKWHDGNGDYIHILRIEGDIVFYKVVTVDGKVIKPTLTGVDCEFESMSSKNKIFETYELVR